MGEPVLPMLSPSAVRAELAYRHYQLLIARTPLPFDALALQAIRLALDTGSDEHVHLALKASAKACIAAEIQSSAKREQEKYFGR